MIKSITLQQLDKKELNIKKMEDFEGIPIFLQAGFFYYKKF